MSDTFIGEIRMFAGTFAPQGWMFCNGQLISIAENDTLFFLIGTTYGGDGVTTFGLPDLRSRVPVHQGTSFGTPYVLGQTGGLESVTLNTSQLPNHYHSVAASSTVGHVASPANAVLAAARDGERFTQAGPDATMAPGTVTNSVGAGQPHENMPPYLTVHFIISLFGIFPTQS